MMNSPISRKPGVRTMILRVVSWVRRLHWISIGALAPRPEPSTVKLLPRPTMRHRK